MWTPRESSLVISTLGWREPPFLVIQSSSEKCASSEELVPDCLWSLIRNDYDSRGGSNWELGYY